MLRLSLLVLLIDFDGVEFGDQVLLDDLLGLLVHLVDLDSEVCVDRLMIRNGHVGAALVLGQGHR